MNLYRNIQKQGKEENMQANYLTTRKMAEKNDFRI